MPAVPKKKKKVKRTTLLNKADGLFSKIIRTYGRCRRCGSISNLQCAHIVSRWYHAVRWDFDNAVCLCSGCHVYYTYRPLEWEEWVDKIFGKEYHYKLKQKALTQTPPTYEEIIEVLLNYKVNPNDLSL